MVKNLDVSRSKHVQSSSDSCSKNISLILSSPTFTRNCSSQPSGHIGPAELHSASWFSAASPTLRRAFCSAHRPKRTSWAPQGAEDLAVLQWGKQGISHDFTVKNCKHVFDCFLLVGGWSWFISRWKGIGSGSKHLEVNFQRLEVGSGVVQLVSLDLEASYQSKGHLSARLFTHIRRSDWYRRLGKIYEGCLKGIPPSTYLRIITYYSDITWLQKNKYSKNPMRYYMGFWNNIWQNDTPIGFFPSKT